MATPVLHLIVPAGLGSVSEAGSRIRGFLQSAGLDDLDVFHIELAIVEVITNVARHGCPESEEIPITVQVTVTAEAVQATIEDAGSPPPMRRGSGPADPLAEGGRGIDIIYSVMDEVSHVMLKRGNIIALTKRLRQPAPAEAKS